MVDTSEVFLDIIEGRNTTSHQLNLLRRQQFQLGEERDRLQRILKDPDCRALACWADLELLLEHYLSGVLGTIREVDAEYDRLCDPKRPYSLG